jgi:hypothetical protein
MSEFHHLLQHMTRSKSPLLHITSFIYGLAIDERKVLLKACRIQGPFSKTSRFYKRHRQLLEWNSYPIFQLVGKDLHPVSSASITMWKLIEEHSTLFSSPSSCGLISMLLRYTPYFDYSSVVVERQRAIVKELEASQRNDYLASHIHFDSLIRLNDPEPYKPGYPAIKAIGSKLRGAVRRLSTRIITPQLGKKILPRPCSYDHTWGLMEIFNFGEVIATLEDVERVFFYSGVELMSQTLVRSVWRGNDLKPRVYYSRGASVHRSTTYIQPIFNAFVDALDNTHRILRHSTQTIRLEPEDVLLIYDYSSFTSNLTAITRFTSFLANSFMDFEITILDPHFGLTTIPLGVLLHEYNEEANSYSPFDASEIMDVEEHVLYHSAGMLGIPGNISSSTLLHGIHLAVLVQSMLKNKVVGDDAIVGVRRIDEQDILEGIAELGDLAREKVERWEWNPSDDENEDERYDYKKRPINRIDNFIFTGALLDYPPLNLFGIINPYHRATMDTPIDHAKKAIKSISTFQNALALFPHNITEEDEEHVMTYLSWCYTRLSLNRVGGRCGFCGDYYPPLTTQGLEYKTWYMRYGSDMAVSRRVQYGKSDLRMVIWSKGVEVNMRSNAVMGYLVKMRVIEDISEKEWVAVSDLLGHFGDDVDWINHVEYSRRYRVVDRLPDWFGEYIQTQLEDDYSGY